MTTLAYIQLSTELIAFVTALIYFRELKRRGWLLWLPYLLCTCVVEIYAAYLAHYQNKDTLWLYNPYIIVSIAFYGWFLVRIAILDVKKKKLLYLAISIFSIASMIWYMIWGDPEVLVSVILNIGSLLICLLCLLFFYSHIRNPIHHYSLTTVPGFWIVAGLLVFYTGISLYTAIYNFLAEVQIIILGATIQNFIPQVLSLVLYSTITIAFVQCTYHPKTY